MNAAVPDLPITFGCGLYDRMIPLYSGEVRPAGVDLRFIPVESPGELFTRMLDGEFEAAEMSASDLLRRMSAGTCPFVAIPAFPSRVFRHGMITVRRGAGIRSPKDLEGRRVGVPHFPMTAAVWIRGLLQNEYGVDLSRITWVQDTPFREVGNTAALRARLRDRFVIEDNTSGKSLVDLLDRGGIDGFIGADIPAAMRNSPHVERLFPNFAQDERAYYGHTKIFPIMHTVVVRRDVYDRAPWIGASLYEALTRSKDIARERMRYMGTLRYMLPWMIADIEDLDALFDGDPFVYGFEPNRRTLETLAGYLADQSLLAGPLDLDDVFVDVRPRPEVSR